MHFGDDRGAPLYQRGSKGAEVRLLQQYLTRAGYPTGVDGSYGPATEASVAAFQRAYNIEADGVVYQDTFEALSNVVQNYQDAGVTTLNRVLPDEPSTSSSSTPTVVYSSGAAAPLPPLAKPGTLPQVPTWVLVAGSTLSLVAFAWLLTRKKSPRPALAGYRRRRRSHR